MTRAEQKTLDRLFRELYGKLLQYAFASLENEALSEDAVQDCFRIAAVKMAELSASENPQGWLMNTLKNVLRDQKRRLTRQRMHIVRAPEGDLDETPREKELPEEDEARFSLLYGGLVSDEDFELLKLIYARQYSVQAAAAALGLSEEACKKRLQRARARMKTALEKSDRG